MKNLNLKDNYLPILIGFTAALSFIAWYISWKNNLVLVYNDSMSHLNISRLVIDNKQPGLSQLGSVWLPFSHILTLPLIWIDSAWRSGLAGSLFSMLAYIVTVVSVHGITWEITKKRVASILAALVAALNINLLYLQSTPLTEVLYVALFSSSVYFLIKYLITSKTQYLLPLTFLTTLQMMTRYDGWFFAFTTVLILIGFEVYIRKQEISKALGSVAVYIVPVVFTALLWLGYNFVLFGDPLYFASGPFSARSQQDAIEASAGLITKHNIATSSETMGLTIGHTVGWFVLLIGVIGWLAYLNPWNSEGGNRLKLIVFIGLSSVIVFNVLALFMGFSIINIPELNWNPFDPNVARYFNVRYGVMAIPFVAAGVGLLSSKWKHITPLLITIVVLQSALTLIERPISLLDGLYGASSYRHQDIAEQLKTNVKPDQDVLLSFSSFPAAVHQSNLHLDQYIHEGVSEQWNDTLKQPETNAEWILLSGSNPADQVYDALIRKQNSKFLDSYKLVYESENGRLYRRNDVASKQASLD